MGIINKLFREKANYLLISLLVFASIFLTTNSYADVNQDIAALEDFYYQVFKKESLVKPTKKSQSAISEVKIKTTRKHYKRASVNPAPKSQKRFEVKDPELVAFYQMVFGKTEANSLPKKTNKPTAAVKHPSLNKPSAQIVTKGDFLGTPKVKSTVPTVKSKQTDSTIISTSKKQTHEPVAVETKQGVLSISASSTKKSTPSKFKETDSQALFEKAFGKKPKKTTTAVASKSHANPTDMATLFAKAFGRKSAMSVPSTVKVDLRVNDSTLGEVVLFSNSSGTIDRVATDTLILLLEKVLKDHVFLRVKEELESEKVTTLNQLNDLGIFAFYNSTNLSLDIEIEPELRKPRVLSLLNNKKASVREENKVKAQNVSGFLNGFTTVGLSSRDDETDLRMRLEGSLNIGGAVLETTSDYRNKNIDFGRTTLTFDRPEKLQRFTLGNISTGSRNFQENLELDGFRISKEFFLDPDLQITPRAKQALQLNSDSEVELYINNILIRRFYLKAGVYSLQDIGLYNGANNIRIRIKDEFGKVTVKTSEQYYDSHLLKPGLSLFAISVGYLSNQQSYSNENLEKTPIFSGYYQKGLSKDLTLSLDAQLSSENFLVGAETISTIKLGSIKNSIAISGGKERDIGFATSFEFRPNKKYEQINLDTLRQDLLGLDTRSRGFLNNWSITGEYRSDDFSLLNGVDPDLTGTSQEIDDVTFGSRVFNNNKFKGNLQTNFSLNISEQWQGTLNLGVADYYDAEKSYYANLSATRRFENGMRLSLGTRYDTEDDFSMNLQLSIPLSRKKGKKRVDLDVLADSRDSAYETKLSVKPTSLVGKNSLAGSLEHFSDKDSRQESLDLQYRNPQFETKFTARNRYSKSSGDASQQVNLGFNTSIACVAGSCATSYPINDSFALVSGPSNQTNPIALSNNNLRFRYSDGNDTGLPDNYTALISGNGKKAVVRLESYRTQNINIDEGTLPNGYDSEKTEFSVFPEYHQGFLLKAGGEPATTLDGMLFDDQKKVLSFKGGQWVPYNSDNLNINSKTVAFFSNKGGRFRVTSIPAGKYKLELFDYPDMEPIHITVPDTKGKAHDLGNLTIKTPNQ